MVFLIGFVAVAIVIAADDSAACGILYDLSWYNKGNIPTTNVVTATAILSRRRRRRFFPSGCAAEEELENIAITSAELLKLINALFFFLNRDILRTFLDL